jgi:hypothetical protein
VRGHKRRRGRGRGTAGEETDPDEPEDVEGRAPSVCDRLRNAAARCVVLAHSLLGDPEHVGNHAREKHRSAYFEALDRSGQELYDKCKLWLGGTEYRTRQLPDGGR